MRDLLYQTFVRKARLIQGGDLPRIRRAPAGRSEDAQPGVAVRSSRVTLTTADEHPGIAEQPHPAPIFRPFLRRPRVLHVRNTRSGCGISEVTRPSALHRPARPIAEPLGLQGYFSVGRSRLSTYCKVTSPLRSVPPRARARDRIRPGLRHAPPRSAAPIRACRRTAPSSTAASRTSARASLVLLGAVAHEARPSSGPGDQFLERREHLAAIAHASVKVASRAKKAANSSRARALNKMDFAQPSPAPKTSP